MARILIAWEMGDSLGHLARLSVIVKELAARGHDLFFALDDTTSLEFFSFKDSVTLLPVPSAKGQWHQEEELVCISSILLQRGYRDMDRLMPLVRCWHGLYRFVRADMYLFDYAPTALLAARGSREPKVLIGSGYGSLVAGQPDVNLVPWHEKSQPLVARHEAAVVNTVNKVCHQYHYEPLRYLSDMYRSDLSMMSCIPELDNHQRDPASTIYFNLPFGADDFFQANWRGTGRTKVFAYLKAHLPQSAIVLEILTEEGYDAICYCAGLDAALAEKYRRRGLKLYLEPVSLADILPTARIVICHAGKELVSQSLCCGVPVLLMPGQLEQYHTALAVEQFGAGLRVPQGVAREGIESRLDELELDPAYRRAAQLIGKRNQDYDGDEKLEEMMGRIEILLDN